MESTEIMEDSTGKKSGAHIPGQKIDFEKYIEESLEDADLLPEDGMDKEKLAAMKKNRDSRPELIQASTKQIADIISQNELIEQAKQERVRAILDKQIRVYERKSEILERLEKEMDTLKSKYKVAKAANKKAKSLKLDKKIMLIIKKDLAYIAEAIERCNEMMQTEKKDLKKIGSLINLLDSAS
ncbi:MAG: hypothetical protein K9H16_16300 [Bacteroidales bacterium]|nr:hypothetical protein [Bacteroidales bacterium]